MKSLALACLTLVGCSTTREARSAAEDRNEAAIHTQQAQLERDAYDPSKTKLVPMHSPFASETPSLSDDTYNPTGSHLVAADREMREAAADLKAAREIEAFEHAQCNGIPLAERAACPLLASAVTSVTETPVGIALFFKPDVDATDTYRRLACHLAYAESKGFERPSCPLFGPGMKIKLLPVERHGLEMTADNTAHASELKAQARRIFLGSMSVNAAGDR